MKTFFTTKALKEYIIKETRFLEKGEYLSIQNRKFFFIKYYKVRIQELPDFI